MGNQKDKIYYKGYVAGYRDGVRDAEHGKTTTMIESDITFRTFLP